MANQIPHTSGNAHGGKGGKAIGGKDPHAGKKHKKMNAHHGMKHALGHVAGDGSHESTGSGSHEDAYCCDGPNTD